MADDVTLQGRYGPGLTSITGDDNHIVVSIYSNNVAVKSLTLEHGSTSTSTGAALAVQGNGTVTIDGCTLQASSATYGGGLYVNGATVTVKNSFIQANTANRGAGAYVASGELDLATTTVRGNTSSSDGGAMYLAKGTLTDADGSWSNNTAAQHGGGLYVQDGTVTLQGTIFQGNTAVDGGGAYMNAGMLTTTSAQLLSNVASASGGGLYLAGGSSTHSDLFAKSNVARGGSGQVGGAVALDGGSISADNSELTANEAHAEDANGNPVGNDGGALLVLGSGNASFGNSTIDANVADLNGGAFSCNGVCAIDITDTVVTGNVGATSGVINFPEAGAGPAELHCTSSTTGAGRVVGNKAVGSATGLQSAGAARIGSSQATVTSNACDWGRGAEDNPPVDIVTGSGTWNYPDGSSFTCTNRGCSSN